MENLAHTLLGLSFAKGGLERSTPLATTALVLSSNLPDIDVLMQLDGGSVAGLEYHRGFTHSFAGLVVVAAALTVVLIFTDKIFRLRRDPFRRPILPVRIFLLSYAGGLGHLFMDFTNSYGVRPLEPFSNRWFYGDLVFVVDPWIWLILGSAVVWLTARSGLKIFAWLALGTLLSFVMLLAPVSRTFRATSIPTISQVVWFVGLAAIAICGLLGWRRKGPNLARWSLLVLALYYGAMSAAHRAAVKQGFSDSPVSGVTQLAAWPVPTNPTVWQAAARDGQALYYGKIDIRRKHTEWYEVNELDPAIAAALNTSRDGAIFLRFMRFGEAEVSERPDGFSVGLRDLRFGLRMHAELDSNLKVESTSVRWF
jgi:inner membrane protein